MQDAIEVDLGGHCPAILRPTLGAAISLSKRHGGLMNVLAALERYDFDIAVEVVEAGMRVGAEQHQIIAEKVFSAGVVALTPNLVRFVILLANGGRPLKEKGEEAEQSERPFV